MQIEDRLWQIMYKNHHLKKYKDDTNVHKNCIRVIRSLVHYGLCVIDEQGRILGKELSRLSNLSNFDLLHMIESIIAANFNTMLDEHMVKEIRSIDYIGQCWYFPKELSVMLLELYGERHNFRKIKKMLENWVSEGKCIKLTDKKRRTAYRILFTLQTTNATNN
ncbi:hypothetical protein H6504_05025 [Candidatus Woesearchaeota archaeon]|nr:hypothetical protein [Candidatus Woesearchaeota archaeon]